jgi:hypothetical protein
MNRRPHTMRGRSSRCRPCMSGRSAPSLAADRSAIGDRLMSPLSEKRKDSRSIAFGAKALIGSKRGKFI